MNLNLIEVLEETKKRIAKEGIISCYYRYFDPEEEKCQYCAVGHFLLASDFPEPSLADLFGSADELLYSETFDHHTPEEKEAIRHFKEVVESLGIEKEDLIALQKLNDEPAVDEDSDEHRQALIDFLDKLIDKYKSKVNHETCFSK